MDLSPQRNGFCCTMKSMRDSGPPLSGGEVTKEDLVRQRFETFFASLGRAVDGRERRRNCTAGSWMNPHFLLTGPWSCATI